MGTLVSLPVMVVDSEEAWNKAGDAYARVMVVDADRATIGPLNLWDFLASEFEINGVYMFRGLRVAPRRVYNEQTGQWQRTPSAGKVLECNIFTAIEAVEHDTVRCYFS